MNDGLFPRNAVTPYTQTTDDVSETFLTPLIRNADTPQLERGPSFSGSDRSFSSANAVPCTSFVY